MSILNRAALAIILVLLSGSSFGDGINNPKTITGTNAIGFGEGVNNFGIGGSGGAPVTPCSGTGLIFNIACNSQYVGVIQ